MTLAASTRRRAFAGVAFVVLAGPAFAQEGTAAARAVPIDSARAARLYVSTRPEDHPARDHARDIADKQRNDSIWRAHAAGAYELRKIRYRSSADGMEIPAYLYLPLQKRGARGHAAMLWVHGGVHGDWSASLLPFVREAVQRGYVILAPDYRGSTGYGAAHYDAIDYGGLEIDDVVSGFDYLAREVPDVDTARVGIMGWSHGGFITAHALFRDRHPFKAGAAHVPVTNLLHRLSRKGPGYQRSFATQRSLQALPFEKPQEYLKRSPLYHVDKLQVPMLVHVATNDLDVNFDEDVQLVYALRSQKPQLAETKIYVDPPGWGSSVGHAFNRRVDGRTFERSDTPEQIDSWNRVWTFFDWILRPYEDRSKPAPVYPTTP